MPTLHLVEDGDTSTYEGHTYTLRLSADDQTIMEEQGEGVWCGRLEWSERRDTRPAGFDGNAEIVHRDRSGVLWWQPEPDVKRSDRDAFTRYRRTVLDVIEDGYVYAVLESDDGYRASLGGIAGMDADYCREVAGELLAEIVAERVADAERAARAWNAAQLVPVVA